MENNTEKIIDRLCKIAEAEPGLYMEHSQNQQRKIYKWGLLYARNNAFNLEGEIVKVKTHHCVKASQILNQKHKAEQEAQQAAELEKEKQYRQELAQRNAKIREQEIAERRHMQQQRNAQLARQQPQQQAAPLLQMQTAQPRPQQSNPQNLYSGFAQPRRDYTDALLKVSRTTEPQRPIITPPKPTVILTPEQRLAELRRRGLTK